METSDKVSRADIQQIEEGLTAFNEANSDVGDWHQKSFVIRDEQEQVAGGIIINVHWY